MLLDTVYHKYDTSLMANDCIYMESNYCLTWSFRVMFYQLEVKHWHLIFKHGYIEPVFLYYFMIINTVTLYYPVYILNQLSWHGEDICSLESVFHFWPKQRNMKLTCSYKEWTFIVRVKKIYIYLARFLFYVTEKSLYYI